MGPLKIGVCLTLMATISKNNVVLNFFFNTVVLLLLFCFKYILNLISKPTSNSQSAEQSKATVPFNWS